MCEGIQDSLGFSIQNYRFLDSGFQLLMDSVSWLYRGFQSQGFWIPQVKFSRRIQDSTNNNFQDSGFRIPQAKIFRIPESLTCGERIATKNIPVAEYLNSVTDCFFILWYCSLFCRRWHIFTRFFVKKMIIPHDGFSFFGFDDQVALMTVLSEVAFPIFSSCPRLKWAATGRTVTSRYHGSKLSGSQQ